MNHHKKQSNRKTTRPHLEPQTPPDVEDDEVDDDEVDDDEVDDDEVDDDEVDDDEVDDDEVDDDQEDEDDDDEDEDDDDDDEDDDDEDEEDDRSPPAATVDNKKPDNRITTAADKILGYATRLTERQSKVPDSGLVGAATGLTQLDQATGGVQQMTIIAGRTQTGKTSLAAQISIAALRNDPKLAVDYYLMDNMVQDELFDQIICSEARIDHANYTGGKLSSDEQKRVKEVTARLQKEVLFRMRINDRISNQDGLGLEGWRIFDFCQALMEQVGAERVLVVLDMLNDLPHPNMSGNWPKEYHPNIRRIESDPDRWRLEQLLELRKLSEKICDGGWPVLALCQLRKQYSQREEDPTIEDLLGGVNLGYKAQQVYFLLPDPKADPRKPVVPVTLAIMKARFGQTIRLPLQFHHTQFRFEEVNSTSSDNSGSVKRRKPNRLAGK